MSGYLPPGCTQRECDMAQPGYWGENDPACPACDDYGCPCCSETGPLTHDDLLDEDDAGFADALLDVYEMMLRSIQR